MATKYHVFSCNTYRFITSILVFVVAISFLFTTSDLKAQQSSMVESSKHTSAHKKTDTPASVKYVQQCVTAVKSLISNSKGDVNSCEDGRFGLHKPKEVMHSKIIFTKGDFEIEALLRNRIVIGFANNHLYAGPAASNDQTSKPITAAKAVSCESGGFWIFSWTKCQAPNGCFCEWDHNGRLLRCVGCNNQH